MGFRQNIRRVIGQGEKRIRPNWILDLKNKVLSPPKISSYIHENEEIILVGTQEGKLYQMKTEGQVMWTFDATNSLNDQDLMFIDSETINSINTVPLIMNLYEDKAIVFGTESGDLFCLDTKGNLLWKQTTSGPIRGCPVLSDFKNGEEQIIVGSNDGILYIFSKTGELVEAIDVESAIETSPLHVKELLIIGTRDGEVLAINKKSEISWRFKTEDRITANIINTLLNEEHQEILLVASQDNNLYALNHDGEVQWTFSTDGALISQVTAQDINNDNKKEIIFGSCDNKIY